VLVRQCQEIGNPWHDQWTWRLA